MSAAGLDPIEAVMAAALGRVFPAAQLEVRQHGRVLLSRAYGWLDPETRRMATRPDTLFDLASVTKLFVVTAFMTLVEEGSVGLDQPVCTVLPDFSGERPIRPYEDPLQPGAFVAVAPGPGVPPGPEGHAATTVDASRVTFRNLLAHNSGLPAWRPLFREGSPQAARRLALTTHFSYPTGARVVYSDIGLILLGMSVERLTGLRLDEAVRVRVTEPLRVSGIRYFAVGCDAPVARAQSPGPNPQYPNIAATEFCAWRGRRLVGEVHDENAWSLGGIAGHAGLFATAHDLASFGQSFLDALWTGESANGESANGEAAVEIRHAQGPNSSHGGIHIRRRSQTAWERESHHAISLVRNTQYGVRTILRPTTVAEMARLQAEDGNTRRGLGFVLWSPDPEASGNPFSERAFGHTGFTGTSLWMDPERDLVVACLTNRVYYGRDAGGILAFRVALHRAIVEVVGSRK